MFDKPFTDITVDDLQLLQSNSVPEGTQLDYKQSLPTKDDEGKKEFLRDVSAMANSNGGDLVYGVSEVRGDNTTDISLTGVPNVDFDATKLWMENLIRDCIKPRLVISGIRQLQIDETKVAIVVRVPRSWNSPHVVEFSRYWRFYSRNSAGNYQLDISQVRDAFVFGESLAQRSEEFRLDRLSKIMAEPSLKIGPKLVIHLQSLESLRPASQISIDSALAERELMMLAGYDTTDSNLRHNFDGLLASVGSGERGYLQLFARGAVEEVDAHIVAGTRIDGLLYLPSLSVERWIIKAAGRRLLFLRKLGITSPIIIQVSMMGVKGFRFKAEDVEYHFRDLSFLEETADANPIDRQDLLFTSVVAQTELGELEGSSIVSGEPCPNHWLVAAQLMRSTVDTLARAMGMPRSLYYNSEGRRVGRVEL